MIDSQEMVFVVDENNKPVEPKLRSVAHKQSLWHRTSGIWVINTTLQILCQKRSLKKDVKPGFWEAYFGGHLAPNEDYLHNGASEVGEELGITVSQRDLISYGVVKSVPPAHPEFQHIFALMLNKPANEFPFEKEEIDQLEWKDIDEVRKILVERKDKEWVIKPWDEAVLNWLIEIIEAHR